MVEVGTSAAPPPTLLSLCLDAVAASLATDSADRGGWPGGCSSYGLEGLDDECEGEEEEDQHHLSSERVAEALPWELLHRLASRLPPVALESLHHAAQARCCSPADINTGLGGTDGNKHGMKRSRCEDFNTAWQALFQRRWPVECSVGHHALATVDWQQQYWEKHLQECLDQAAESAMLPSFRGSVGELSIPAKIRNFIYNSEDIPLQLSSLSHQCSTFGCYARSLRLQSVLCSADTYDLFRYCKVEKFMFIRIISETEVHGVCLLLSCHAETLRSLEFIHCHLYPAVMDRICKSLCQKESLNHSIQCFSIKSSRVCVSKPWALSDGLLNFLSSGKSLCMLSLNDTKMQPSFVKMIFHTLMESSRCLQSLDISEHNISGWLSTMDKDNSTLALGSDISMNSLSVLTLRGNNLQKGDVKDLCKILVKMPNLRELDISGNPIMDDGLRLFIPFISLAIEKETPLRTLRLDNCDVSTIGVSKLLDCLTFAKEPLDMLSIADNPVGSSVAGALAKFLGSRVRDVNVEDIGLGTLGFQTLEEALPMEVALSHINISKNRGGIKAVHFIRRLILQAPNLVSINAAANLLPPESLEVICDTLKQRTCNLERVDLTGNMHLSGTIIPGFHDFKKHGKPILVVPPQFGTSVPHDDDP